MRVIVYGIGAVGGVLSAALAHAGAEVIGIARGAQLEAIRAGGLRLRSPKDDVTVRLDCVGDPSGIAFRADDMILLTMKGQHTGPALERLRAVGVADQPIFCFQNGIANERAALRLFANVHGVTVMMPSAILRPGEVAAFAAPRLGMFDIGRYPAGVDASDKALADILEGAGFAAFPNPDVMASKTGKLLMNLGNIAQAALGLGADTAPLRKRLRAEGEAVLAAAGIAVQDVGLDDPRREAFMSFTKIPGIAYQGGSTTQSLARGAGSVETDFLNGEIVLLGRLHGVPVPANAYMCDLAARMARDGTPPGAFTPEAVMAGIDAAALTLTD
ncbi:MAG: ketopantoate reductase family protein [Rhodobacteraceae bacterium]|nr:ketopantoate reductase family protein [Paracoccaceae bacterium]